MTKPTSTIDPQSDRKIVITRIFNAPRELVFKAVHLADALAGEIV